MSGVRTEHGEAAFQFYTAIFWKLRDFICLLSSFMYLVLIYPVLKSTSIQTVVRTLDLLQLTVFLICG